MTTLPDTTHVTPLIDAYLAGGLDEAERRAVEAHADECAACGAALDAARLADRRLTDAFAGVLPPTDYEARLLGRLRPGLRKRGGGPGVSGGRWPRLAGTAAWAGRLRPGAIHPAVRRIATAAAAAVVLGAVGYGVQWGEDARREAGTVSANPIREEQVVIPESTARPVTKYQSDPTVLTGANANRHNDFVEQDVLRRSATPTNGRSTAGDAYGYLSLQDGEAVAQKERLPALSDARGLTAGQSGGQQARWYGLAAGGGDAASYFHYYRSTEPAVAGRASPAKNAQPTSDFDVDGTVAFDRQKRLSETESESTVRQTPADGKKLFGTVGAGKDVTATGVGPASGSGAVASETKGVALNRHVTPQEADRKSGSSSESSRGRGAVAQGVAAADGAVAPWSKWGDASGDAARADGNGPVDGRGFVSGGAGSGGGGFGGRLGGGGGGANGSGNHGGVRGTTAGGDVARNFKGAEQNSSVPEAAGIVALGVTASPGAAGAAPGQTSGGLPAGSSSLSTVNGIATGVSAPAGGGVAFSDQTPGNGPAAVSGPVAVGGPVNTATNWEFRSTVLDAPKVVTGQSFKPTDLFYSEGVVGEKLAKADKKSELAEQKGKDAKDGPAVAAGDRVELGQLDVLRSTMGRTPGDAGAARDVELKADDQVAADPKPPAATPPPTPLVVDSAAPAKPAEVEKAAERATPADPAAAKVPAPATPPAPEPSPPAPPATATPPAANPAPGTPPAVEAPRPVQRKIIRHGNVVFEVDSFDSALRQVNAIVAEENGFIATTDSEKLPNGRVKGSVTLRCPPERLDVLVLKLRGLGELKSQKILADDVTKQYTDLEAQLVAGRAMYERLLAIIKAGGAVKDLLEAEKQLGVWREKLERLEGERRYLENLVSMSTLIVELAERDVRGPTSANEQESVNTSIETEEVEKARADAIKAIESAKGRVVDSNLTKHEGGQLSSTIVADVSPDNAGPVIDRLKQLGKVARLDITRKTTAQGGVGPIIPGLRIERRETRFQISIYNLAKVAPRQSATLTVAAADVEATYKAILEQTRGLGATIVASQLSRPRADQMVATVRFEVPVDKADAASALVRAGVDVMQMQTAVSEDRDNTTDAKRGFSVEVKSLAHVPPRETTTLTLAAPAVPASFAKLLEAARGGGGRVITSQLNEQDPNNISGTLDFEVTRDKWQPVADALAAAGVVVTRNVTRSPDTETTVDSKVRLSVSVIDDIKLAPRETVAAQVASATVADTFATIAAAARDAGARVVGSNLNLADRTNPNGVLTFAVPRENAIKVETVLKAAGVVVSRTVNRLADGPMNVETKIGFEVRVLDEVQLVPRELVAATVATRQVPEAFNALAEAARSAGARAVGSNLDQADKANPVGRMVFAVPKENAEKFEAALKAAGLLVARTVNRQSDGPMVVDTKAGFDVRVVDERTLKPREEQSMVVVTRAIKDRYAKALDALRLIDAQVIDSRVDQPNRNTTVGKLEFVVRRSDQPTVEKALSDGADVFDRTVVRSQDAQGTVDHVVRLSVTLRDADQQPPRQRYEMSAEVPDVERAAADLEVAAVGFGGRRADLQSSMANGRATAVVVLDVPLAQAGAMVNAVRSAAPNAVNGISVSRDENVPEGSLSRARLSVTLTPPASVQANRGLGDTVREGLSTSLTGLFESLRFVIIGLCLVLPWVIVAWVAYRLIRRSRRRDAATGDGPTNVTPPTTPPAGGGAAPAVVGGP